jgi:hypothetical protein
MCEGVRSSLLMDKHLYRCKELLILFRSLTRLFIQHHHILNHSCDHVGLPGQLRMGWVLKSQSWSVSVPCCVCCSEDFYSSLCCSIDIVSCVHQNKRDNNLPVYQVEVRESGNEEMSKRWSEESEVVIQVTREVRGDRGHESIIQYRLKA